jgi:hypothetical protein
MSREEHRAQSQTHQGVIDSYQQTQIRDSETRSCWQGIEECTCPSAGDTVKTGSVVRGSEGSLEVMMLGVNINAAGGLWGVDDVRQECRSNVLWVWCVWGADAGSVGKEAEPKASLGASLLMGRNMAAPSARATSHRAAMDSHAAVAISEVV